MRTLTPVVFATALALITGSTAAAAQADPYRWCSNYMGEDGGSSNCYFMTIEQCRANVSGVGGFCSPNPFYRGAATADEELRRKKRRYR
jgi:hypothetical protein